MGTAPTFILSTYFNSEIVGELIIWNRKHKLGKILGSNSAFYLPDSSLKGPDAAFISNVKWNSLSNDEKRSFPFLMFN